MPTNIRKTHICELIYCRPYTSSYCLSGMGPCSHYRPYIIFRRGCGIFERGESNTQKRGGGGPALGPMLKSLHSGPKGGLDLCPRIYTWCLNLCFLGGDDWRRLYGGVGVANKERWSPRWRGGHPVTTPAEWNQHIPYTPPTRHTPAAPDWHTHRWTLDVAMVAIIL